MTNIKYNRPMYMYLHSYEMLSMFAKLIELEILYVKYNGIIEQIDHSDKTFRKKN